MHEGSSRNPAAVDAVSVEVLFARFREHADAAAFRALVERTAPELKRIARKLGVVAADVDDVMQETYTAAVAGADRFDVERALVQWLGGILYNKAMSARRQRRRTLEPDRLTSMETPEPSASIERAEVLAALELSLKALPATYREVLLLHYEEQKSPAAIAAALGRNSSTVRTQIRRGVRHLRAQLPPSMASAALASLLLPSVLRGQRSGEPVTASSAPAIAGPAAMTWLGAGAVLVAGVLFWSLGVPARVPQPQGSRVAASALGAARPRAAAPRSPSRAPAAVPSAAAPPRAAVAESATHPVVVELFERQTGAPIAGAAIGVGPSGHGVPRALSAEFRTLHGGVTDAAGRATFQLTPGRWGVRFGGTSGSAPFDSDTSEPVRVPVERVRAVRGLVVDGAGQPVVGAEVWHAAQAGRGVDRPYQVGRTGPDGEFALSLVDVPWTRLWALHPDRGSSVAVAVRFRTHDPGQPVVLTLLPQHATLSGRVVDANGRAIAAAAVAVSRLAPDPWLATRHVRTDATGAFEVPALGAGRHWVVVDHERGLHCSVSVELPERGAREVRLEVAGGARLLGQVVDAAGAACSNVLILARPAAAGPRPPATDFLIRLAHAGTDGSFDLRDVPVGAIDLFAVDADRGRLLARRQHHVEPGCHELRLTISPETRQRIGSDILLEIARWARRQVQAAVAAVGTSAAGVGAVTGVVAVDDPWLNDRVWVTLSCTDGRQDAESLTSRLDPAGAFRFEAVLAGDYALEVYRPGDGVRPFQKCQVTVAAGRTHRAEFRLP
ncbi:MAG: sigma-70 family RNA polymerase sigma factor [Planctomycetota bacterium]